MLVTTAWTQRDRGSCGSAHAGAMCTRPASRAGSCSAATPARRCAARSATPALPNECLSASLLTHQPLIT